MKKNIIPLILISSIFLVLIISNIVKNNSSSIQIADGFTIDQFDTNIEIFSNNTFSVDEHITVNWNKAGLQGLVRIVPNVSKYMFNNGKIYKRNLNISTLHSSEQYSICEKIANNQLKLTIGKPGESVQLGSHTYQIKYDGDFGNDPNNGFDEFIFYAYGDNWGTKINNPSISITLPTSADNLNIKFFADKDRKEDISRNMIYSVDGRTIKAIAQNNYSLDRSLVVDIIFPEGYFTNTRKAYTNISAYICILSLVICVSLFVLWIIFNKNNPKLDDYSKTSYPPDNLDASQVGYIFKNVENNKKLSVSLIISLVVKGYIKIYETGKNQYSIFNLTVENKNSFRNNDNIPIPEGFTFEKKSNLTPLSNNELIIFYKLFEDNDVNQIYNDSELYTVFSKISKELKSSLSQKLDLSKNKSIPIIAWILTISSLMLMILGYYGINNIEPKYQFLYIIGWISCIISIIPSFFIGKKDLYGDKIRLQVNDFKSFIEKTEPSMLEKLLNEDSMYYYKILPYAYVFSLNKNWVDKFKSLKISDEVRSSMDTIDYFDYYIIDNISDNIHYPLKDK